MKTENIFASFELPPALKQKNSNSETNLKFNREAHSKNIQSSVRFDYIRKTLVILVLQISITIGLVANFLHDPILLQFIQESKLILTLLSLLAFFICCLLFFKKEWTNQFPINFLLIFLFTFCESYITSYYLSKIEDHNLLVTSLGITFGITIVLSIYSCLVNKTNNGQFVEKGMIYTAISYATLLSFFVINIGMVQSPFYIIYQFLGAMFYGYAILNDVEKLMINREIDCDDYIFEAMMLYIHILNLFYKILKLLAAKKE